jgi:hypothetical protein
MRVLAVGFAFALLCAMVITGCKPKIPDGIFGCKADKDCPSGQFCHADDGLCHGHRETATRIGDGGASDAGLDGGSTAVNNHGTGGKSGGTGGTTSGAGTGGSSPGTGGSSMGTGGSSDGTGGSSAGSGGSGSLGPCVLGTSTIGNCVLQ